MLLVEPVRARFPPDGIDRLAPSASPTE